MSDLYLNPGETLIMTTHRVGINFIPFDLILTSRRLLLIDSVHGRFKPQTLPLSEIFSVKGETITTGEPVITISITDPEDPALTRPLDFIFAQNPGEKRKQERDDWLRKLMESLVSVRQEKVIVGLVSTDIEFEPRYVITRNIAPELLVPVQVTISRVPGAEPVSPEQTPLREADTDVQSSAPPLPSQEPGFEGPAAQIPANIPAIDTPVLPGEPDADAGLKRDQINEIIRRDVVWPVISPTPGTGPDTMPHSGERAPVVDAGDSPVAPEEAPEKKVPAEPAEPAVVVWPVIAGTPDNHVGSLSGISSPVPYERRDVAIGKQEVTPTSITSPEPSPAPVEGSTSPSPEEIPAKEVSDEPSPSSRTSDEHVSIPAGGEFPGTGSGSGNVPRESSPIVTAPEPRRVPVAGIIAAVAIIAIILLALALGVHTGLPGGREVIPTISPVGTITPPVVQNLAPTEVPIPATGVWIRVQYPGYYYGLGGDPASLQQLSGSGDQFYFVRNAGSLIQVDVQKKDSSGETLFVGVYNNGTMINQDSVRAPMGTVRFLINSSTGKPPGFTTAGLERKP